MTELAQNMISSETLNSDARSSRRLARTAEDEFQILRSTVYERTDRLFAGLMAFQYIGGILAALYFAPRAYSGEQSSIHPHVFAAVFLGALISFPPIFLGLCYPGRTITRYMISVCQALTSGLLIHLTNGRIETHFHIFGSLAFLAFYRDWRLLIPATIVTAVDHFFRGYFIPQSIFGVLTASPWRWVEHATYVIFEDAFLIAACLQSVKDMRAAAEHTTASSRKDIELDAIRDTALDCIIGMDHLGRITDFNAAAEHTFGIDRKQALGRQLDHVLVPPSFRQAHTKGLANYLKTGVGPMLGKRIEVPALRADGTEFPVEVAISAIRLDGPPIFVAYMRDITERQKAEEQAKLAAKLSLVASRTDNAVIITDTEGKIEWANEGFTRVTGYRLDEVVGRRPGSFLQGPDTDPATVARMRDHLQRGQGFTAEIVNYGKDGRRYWLAIEVQPVRDADGTLRNFMAIESDITERKGAEVALVRAKEAADAARRTAEAANVAKSQFLANMSHEIRTPLNGVIGMADLMIRKGGLTEQQQRYATVIKSSGDSLLTLINDVLDFSKIEAGKLELSIIDFDLQGAIEDVVEMLAPKAAAKGLAIACRVATAAPARVSGDPDRLRQVLINLVSNAIKFTEKGEVFIDAEVAGRDAAHATIKFSVRDSGLGIPQERIDRLFKSFSQVDASTTRKFGGTGLGLAIVKQLAELMGGTVGVNSTPGNGSTFWFTARFAVAAETQRPTRTLANAIRGIRVLAVDDQPTYLEVIREQLSAWGLEVHTVSGGEQAIAAIRQAAAEGNPFRVGLIDMVMPGVDGPAVARAVNADPAMQQTALIMLTAMDNPFDPVAMRAAGFANCLTKPVRQSTLFDTLADTLARNLQSTPVAKNSDQPARSDRALTGHILLAEDNEINQEVARELVTDAGCVVDVVGNGKLAVEAFLTKKYDLILMDCQMPEMDGFTATRRIRQLEQGMPGRPRIPIVALTANAVQGDREACLQAGMDGYVSKPIDPDALIEALRKHLPAASTPAVTAAPVSAAPVTPAIVQSPATDNTSVPVDMPSLLGRCNGKSHLALKLLDIFSTGIDAQLAQLHSTLGSTDWPLCSRVAHSIRGASANLSASRVSAAASSLEKLANEGNAQAAEEALAALEKAVRECVDYIPKIAEARVVSQKI